MNKESDKYRKQGIKDAILLLIIFPIGFIGLIYLSASYNPAIGKIGTILLWTFVTLFATFGLVGEFDEKPESITIKENSPILKVRRNKLLKWSVFFLLIAIQSAILVFSYSIDKPISSLSKFTLLFTATIAALLFVKRKKY